MSKSGPLAPPTPPFDKLAIENMKCDDFFHADYAIRNLSSQHDIRAVQQHLLLQPDPSLWLSFLQNKAIWCAFDDELLDDMQRHTYKIMDHNEIDNPWKAVHKALLADFKQVVYLQNEDILVKIALIENIQPGESFDAIYDDVLQSNDVRFWSAFITNPAIYLALEKKQYYQLLLALQTRVATQIPLDNNWVILLLVYALKGYPLNYIDILKQFPTHYPCMMNYAVAQIAKYCVVNDNQGRAETTKWLKFVIMFAFADNQMLSLTRNNALLISLAPKYLRFLSTFLLFEFLQIFPDVFNLVLQHIHEQMLQLQVGTIDRCLQETTTLVKALNADAKFSEHIRQDIPCTTLLNYCATMEAKYRPLSAKIYTPAFKELTQPASTPYMQVDAFAEQPSLPYATTLQEKLRRSN